MDKDRILQASRAENTVSDERETLMKLKGSDFALGVLTVMSLFLTTLSALKGVPSYAIYTLVSATLFSTSAYQLITTKTKTALFFTVAMLAVMCVYGYKFITGIL